MSFNLRTSNSIYYKHNYRLSLDEERSAKETLEKAKMQRSSSLPAPPKGRVLLDETFLEEHGQDMTDVAAESGLAIPISEPLPSFRSKRKNKDEIKLGIETRWQKMDNLISDKNLNNMKPVVKLQMLYIRKSPYPTGKKARYSPYKKLKMKPVIALEKLNRNRLLSNNGGEHKKADVDKSNAKSINWHDDEKLLKSKA